MILIPEQVKSLRDRARYLRRQIEEKSNNYGERDRVFYENIGMPTYGEYQEDALMHNMIKELETIQFYLRTSQFLVERDLEKLSIGTGFYMDFGDEVRRALLVEDGTIGYGEYPLVSLQSDFGKAAQGHKDGDTVNYKSQASNQMIQMRIAEIDRVRENYVYYINEVPYNRRTSEVAEKELNKLKRTDREEYTRRHQITSSQKELAEEELKRVSRSSNKTPHDIRRRTFLTQQIRDNKQTVYPEENKIGLSSIVELELKDEFGNTHIRTGEMINRAISTELAPHYIERITPLGLAIFGLEKDATFVVKRNHRPNLKGRILSVDNSETTAKQYVKK